MVVQAEANNLWIRLALLSDVLAILQGISSYILAPQMTTPLLFVSLTVLTLGRPKRASKLKQVWKPSSLPHCVLGAGVGATPDLVNV